MKKLFLLLFIFPTFYYAQESNTSLVFSLQQIDSIAERNGNSLHDVYSTIKVEKDRFLWGKKIIGTGSGSNSFYEYITTLKRK